MRATLIALLLSCCVCGQSERKRFQSAVSATVQILRADGGSGTGVVLGSFKGRPIILTCAHVVSDFKDVIISPPRGAPALLLSADVVRLDVAADLALLIARQSAAMPYVDVAGKAPLLYEHLTVSGYPDATLGVVFDSVLTYYWPQTRHVPARWSLTGGVFYPGLSGGPVLNSRGQLTCLVMGVDQSPDETLLQGLGYCIPLDTIQKFLYSKEIK